MEEYGTAPAPEDDAAATGAGADAASGAADGGAVDDVLATGDAAGDGTAPEAAPEDAPPVVDEAAVSYAAEVAHVARVVGLPWGVRAADVRAFFATDGLVEGGLVFVFAARCEAYAAFESAEGLEAALAKNREKIGGKR